MRKAKKLIQISLAIASSSGITVKIRKNPEPALLSRLEIQDVWPLSTDTFFFYQIDKRNISQNYLYLFEKSVFEHTLMF